MKLVDNWRAGWRWISNWCMGAATVIQAVWLSLTPDEKAVVPESWAHWITIGLMVFGIIARFVKQKPPPMPPPAPAPPAAEAHSP